NVCSRRGVREVEHVRTIVITKLPNIDRAVCPVSRVISRVHIFLVSDMIRHSRITDRCKPCSSTKNCRTRHIAGCKGGDGRAPVLESRDARNQALSNRDSVVCSRLSICSSVFSLLCGSQNRFSIELVQSPFD